MKIKLIDGWKTEDIMKTTTGKTGWAGIVLATLLAGTIPAAHADGGWGYYAAPAVQVVAPAAYYQAYGYGPGWREHEWREHEWREHEWREHEWREHAWGGGGWRDGGWRGGDWHGGWGHEGGWRR